MKQWISTTREHPWQEKQPSAGTGAEIEITDRTLQKIRGFGGCFNELGAIALQCLSKEDKAAFLDELFSENGCQFNFCRIPVGANDFSESWYSYNETDLDFEMEHFSVERDGVYQIPYIKEAQKRNPDLEFFASPWSPPVWMKHPKAYNYGTLVWEDRYLKAYAKYLRLFIEAYDHEGLFVNQLHIQNEPCSTQKFPSCIWTGEQFRDFIDGYLVDEFQRHQIQTDIWLGTINGPETDGRMLFTRYNDYANTVFESSKCRENVKGVSYQWAGKYAIQTTHQAFPELELIQSESECGDGENTWEYAQYIFELIHHYFINGASAYVYWNMVLPQGGESTWGWRQNSMVSVADGQLIYNPEFYVMKHVSHFVKRGARLLQVNGRWNANTLGFQNPDGKRVIILMNPFHEEKCVAIEGETYQLAPQSFHSIVLD